MTSLSFRRLSAAVIEFDRALGAYSSQPSGVTAEELSHGLAHCTAAYFSALGPAIEWRRLTDYEIRWLEGCQEKLLAGYQLFAGASADGAPVDLKQNLFDFAANASPRAALMLSGGGKLGYFHIGVLNALMRENLLPRVISGSSAGSYIAAIAGSLDDEDLSELFHSDRLAAADIRADSWWGRVIRGPAGKLSVESFEALLALHVPDLTFEEAYERTGRLINLSVSAEDMTSGGLLLSVVTTPRVLLRSAVRASCGVPFVFPGSALRERSPSGRLSTFMPDQKWIDGSITADLPARELRRMYRVNQFIVSMVNPLVTPYLTDPAKQSRLSRAASRSIYSFAKNAVDTVTPAVRMLTAGLPRVDRMIRMWHAVASQDYLGDINIMPKLRWTDPRGLLGVPDAATLAQFVAAGEHAAISALLPIRLYTALDRLLDEVCPLDVRAAIRPAEWTPPRSSAPAVVDERSFAMNHRP